MRRSKHILMRLNRLVLEGLFWRKGFIRTAFGVMVVAEPSEQSYCEWSTLLSRVLLRKYLRPTAQVLDIGAGAHALRRSAPASPPGLPTSSPDASTGPARRPTPTASRSTAWSRICSTDLAGALTWCSATRWPSRAANSKSCVIACTKCPGSVGVEGSNHSLELFWLG